MARYIDAEVMPKDKFWGDLTDREKAKVLQWLIQAPTADVAPKAEIASEVAEAYTALARHYVMDRDLYLAAFKNALAYAEAELKHRYS